MPTTLIALSATGPEKEPAVIEFRTHATLVRGPSDTGKSYIRDCLWYLLGGDRTPKKIPQALGYSSLTLLIDADGEQYEICRALAGGETSLRKLLSSVDGTASREAVHEDTGDLLVRLSGAEGKQLLRSRSKRGAVTGGDLRHWFLLSQPLVISEDPTSGIGVAATQRKAAFHMFLTGSDDSAIQLAKTTNEFDRIAGQILGAEQGLVRARADLPEGQTRIEVAEALERVDTALSAMTSHYETRAGTLKALRAELLRVAEALQGARREHDHSAAMVERFELLDEKYRSDSERLGATWEGVAMFQALEEVSCPLCGTPAEMQIDPRQLRQGAQEGYRRALKVEVEKIGVLRRGLVVALGRERGRTDVMKSRQEGHRARLAVLENTENEQVRKTHLEFSGDPKSLALRRSQLSEQLSKFDEESFLLGEIERLTKARRRQKVPLSRNVGNAAVSVSNFAKEYLHAWGFTGVETVSLDPEACDIVIDGRARLDYGAGKRAVFLAALTIALMTHALGMGYPHLGFVTIDSPLKSYADPKINELREVSASTVTDRFYSWLSKWTGPGQIVILENQDIKDSAKLMLLPIEFVGDGGAEGRQGFYPISAV